MTHVPDWPLSLSTDLAARYAEAAQSLYGALASNGDVFELSLYLAIDECERARAYRWPEIARLKRLRKVRNASEGAHKAAKKLASYLEKWDAGTAIRRFEAIAKRTGVTINSRKAQLGHVALAHLLRELARPRVRIVRGNPGGIESFGPLQRRVANTVRSRWPGEAVVATISLAHLFHLTCQSNLEKKLDCPNTLELLPRRDFFETLSRERTITLQAPAIRYYGTAIENGNCWEAAAKFSQIVFPNHRYRDLGSAAQRWLSNHKGDLVWIGWRLGRK